jgi:ABC-type transporter Mla subunit MlaD
VADSNLGLQIRIGAFILSGLLVFFAIIYLLGAQGRYFERKYDLVAEFTEVGGLIEGATVRLAGVQIGRVTAVELPEQPGGKVRVTLTIARRFSERVRRDSEAKISTQGLLGDKIVEITIGTTAAPALRPGETLATQESVEMQQMFKAGAETLATVRELAASLKTTAERVDRIAKEVETGKGLIHALIYDEPQALTRLNAILTRTQALLARAEQGDHAVGVLLSPDSGKSVRALLAAMDAVGRTATTCSRRSSTTRSTRASPTTSARWRTTSAMSPSGWPRARACWAISPATAAPRARSARSATPPPISAPRWPTSARSPTGSRRARAPWARSWRTRPCTRTSCSSSRAHAGASCCGR